MGPNGIQRTKNILNSDIVGFSVNLPRGYGYTLLYGLGLQDDSKTYDALSLLSLSGIATIDSNSFSKLGYELYGKLPIKSNEILITKYYYESFLRYGYSYHDISINSNEISYDEIIGKTIEVLKYRLSDIKLDFVICWIIDTKIDTGDYNELLNYSYDKNELRKSKSLMAHYQNNSIHSLGFVNSDGIDSIYNISDDEYQGYNFVVGKMPSSKKEIVKIIKYLDKFNNDKVLYRLSNTTDEWINDVNTLMTTYKMIGSIAGAILIGFSSLLLFNYINLSISHKKKEMGILRALGASSSDVFNIFSIEGFIIAIINFILSIIGVYIVMYLFNYFIKKEFVLCTNIYEVNFITIFSLFLISFISCFISIFIPVYNISHKTCAEVIRNN